MFSNWQYRLLAVALALICWYLVTGREKVDVWVSLPVELVKGMPEDLTIRERPAEPSIDVRVREAPRGSWSAALETREPGLFPGRVRSLKPGRQRHHLHQAEDISVPMAKTLRPSWSLIRPAFMDLMADQPGEHQEPARGTHQVG